MAIALDNLGREINNANMTLGEIKGLISTLMKKDVGPAKAVKGNATSKNEKSLDELKKIFETYTKDYKVEVEKQKELLQKVVNNLKEIAEFQKGKSKTTSDKIKKNKGSKEEQTTAKASSALAKEFHRTLGTKGSGWVHDPYCEKALYLILAKITKDAAGKNAIEKNIAKAIENQTEALAGGSNETGTPRLTDEGFPNEEEHTYDRSINGWRISLPSRQELERIAVMNYLVNKINTASNAIQKNFLGFNGFETIVKGISDEERQFTQQIRATAYEIAGVTKESRNLQAIYEQIGTSYKETGMDRSQFQKFYIKTLKTGTRDTRTALSITKSQLNTERQIGVEAGTLNDTFITMAHAGRMNNDQIAQMGRGMRDVAKNTGVTGDALVEAIKGSEQFTDNLSKASILTASSVENIIEITTRAKKLGIANEMQPLMNAMTSSNNLLFEASRGTQALLFQAAGSVGRINDLMNGTILKSKNGINDMARGFDNVLKQFGVESLDAVDNLSDEAKTQLNLQLKAAYGIELGNMRSVIETMREAGKGMAERLEEINKQRKLNLTVEERATLDEKERALKASKSMSILTTLSEATKGTGEGIKGMNEALAKFEKRKGDFEKDVVAMGQTWTTSGNVARQSIQTALDQINMGRKKAGMETMKIDSSDIEAALKDQDSFKLLMNRLTKGEQELATYNKKQLDPITAMEGHLKEINENIRVYTQSLFSKLFNSALGKLVAIAGVLGSILVAVGGMGIELWTAWSSLYSSFKKFIKGKTAGAGTASDVANAANSIIRTPKTLWGKKIQELRIAIKKTDRAIVKAADSAASSIVKSSAKLGDAIEANPAKVFGDVIIDSWRSAKKIAQNSATTVMNFTKRSWEVTTNLAKAGWDTTIKTTTEGWKFFAKTFTNLKSSIQAAGGVAKFTAKSLGGMTRAIGVGIGSAIKGGGLLRLAGSTLFFVVAAIDGLVGSMEAGARAGQIFGKAQKDVTLNEEYAAKTAGLLTGVINGLTFGLLGLFLPMDKITDSIARFNAKIPILTIVLTPLVIALEVLWGVIKGLALGIWEVVKGFGQGVMNIITPVFEGLSDIFSTIGNIFGSTSDKASNLTKMFRDMGGIIGIVSGTIKFIGTAIGWIFRAIGSVIGFILKTVLKIVEGLSYAFEPFAEVLQEVFGAVSELEGAFSEVIMDIWKSVKEVIQPVFDLFGSSDSKVFFETVKNVAKWFGKAAGLLIKSTLAPFLVFAKGLSGIAKLISVLNKVFEPFKMIGSWLQNSIVEPIKNIGSWLWKSITGSMSNFGSWLWENTTNGMAGFGKWLYNNSIGKLIGLGKSATEKGGAILNAINPFNWFKEGTRKVEKTGMGVLHKNEMVIPSKDVETLTAKGSGKFEGKSFISDFGNILTNGFATAAKFPAAVTNVGQELAQRTASTQPATTEVVSPDLGELTSETSEQTILMTQLVNLMQQFVDLAKPKSSIARSSGGEIGDPASRNVVHSPPNYFRSPIGHVSQTAAKAILNVGSQTT